MNQRALSTEAKRASLRLNSLNWHVPKKSKSTCSPKVILTRMLTAGFFHNSHKVETTISSRMNKFCYTFTMQFYIASKRMDYCFVLQHERGSYTVVSKRGQPQRNIYCMIIFYAFQIQVKTLPPQSEL